jgi:hypothetical protein
MGRRAIAILPLIFLAGAAAQQGDCTLEGMGTMPSAAPLDLVGPQRLPAGAGQSVAALPGAGGLSGCRPALPSTAQATILRNDSADVLHGLPAPEITRRLDEPRRAPEFQ